MSCIFQNWHVCLLWCNVLLLNYNKWRRRVRNGRGQTGCRLHRWCWCNKWQTHVATQTLVIMCAVNHDKRWNSTNNFDYARITINLLTLGCSGMVENNKCPFDPQVSACWIRLHSLQHIIHRSIIPWIHYILWF